MLVIMLMILVGTTLLVYVINIYYTRKFENNILEYWKRSIDLQQKAFDINYSDKLFTKTIDTFLRDEDNGEILKQMLETRIKRDQLEINLLESKSE